MAYPRQNALNQALDIAGSLNQVQTMTETDEPNGYGMPTGNAGSAATITAFNNVTNALTLGGLTGMSTTDIGNFITLSGAANSGNNGTFLIINYNSATSVDVLDVNGVFPDANSGSLVWIERSPYSLQDDINYIRTDRQQIKGTAEWYDAIPTYQQPNAIGTFIPANLTNINTHTTDAVAYNVNRAFYDVPVFDGYTQVTLEAPGLLQQANAVDELGIPCFDQAPFTGDWNSCYVHVVDGYTTGSEIVVLSGPHVGERIFGITYVGASTSPNSVEVHFYSAPFPANFVTTHTPYTWESGQTPIVNLLYGFNERLDQMDQNALRSIPALGILTDAALQNEVNNILSQIGSSSGDTSLSGLLTNTSAYYPFYDLPDATPTVVDALNTLNAQIDDRTYTGAILTSGQTITQSLQALANAISGSAVIRTIERLTAGITANTTHTLPGGISYTLDPTNNGLYLWVFTRGVLRDPGPVSTGNDYTETSTTQVTFYAAQNAGDHISYFIR